MHALRLATLHPALAHFALGGLPLVVIGYVLALVRRSAVWAAIGDAALAVATAATLATCAFGLVSDAVVPWPGGLERWRALHLYGGLGATLLLLTIGALRLVSARGGARPGLALGVGVVGAAAGLLGVGWIGGEVLVFHAGMAVRAAGEGALAPPVFPDERRPAGFLPAMREARGAWGDINARLAYALVQHPREQDLIEIERAARRLERMAGVMGEEAGRHGGDADVLASMSQALAGDADDIAQAAHRRDLAALSRAVGETSAHCAECHAETRWKKR